MRKITQAKLKELKKRQYENKLRSYKKHLVKQQEKKNKYFAVNRHLQLIENGNRLGSLRNTLRWSRVESKEHILRKLELCMELRFIEHEFLTEVKFKTGGKCDVLDLTDGTIYEILHTENEKKFEEDKVKKYPKEFKVVRIKAWL